MTAPDISNRFTVSEIRDLLGQLNREEITFSKMVQILNEKQMKKKNGVLFVDANMYNVYEGELIYYVVLTAGGVYKLGWDFSEKISKNMAVWDTLIGLSIVKGLYKNKDKAEESCHNANCGSENEINKAFLKELRK